MLRLWKQNAPESFGAAAIVQSGGQPARPWAPSFLREFVPDHTRTEAFMHRRSFPARRGQPRRSKNPGCYAPRAPPSTGHFGSMVHARRKGSRDVTAAADGTMWVLGQKERRRPASRSARQIHADGRARPRLCAARRRVGPDRPPGSPMAARTPSPAWTRARPRAALDLLGWPSDNSNANLNTGVFDDRGAYWFTGPERRSTGV